MALDNTTMIILAIVVIIIIGIGLYFMFRKPPVEQTIIRPVTVEQELGIPSIQPVIVSKPPIMKPFTEADNIEAQKEAQLQAMLQAQKQAQLAQEKAKQDALLLDLQHKREADQLELQHQKEQAQLLASQKLAQQEQLQRLNDQMRVQQETQLDLQRQNQLAAQLQQQKQKQQAAQIALQQKQLEEAARLKQQQALQLQQAQEQAAQLQAQALQRQQDAQQAQVQLQQQAAQQQAAQQAAQLAQDQLQKQQATQLQAQIDQQNALQASQLQQAQIDQQNALQAQQQTIKRRRPPQPPQPPQPAIPPQIPSQPVQQQPSQQGGTPQSEIDEWVNNHNRIRSGLGISPVTWNEELVRGSPNSKSDGNLGSLDWSKRCDFNHMAPPPDGNWTVKPTMADGTNVGENIAWDSRTNSTISDQFQMWADEGKQYDYQTGTGSDVGHFTQIVNANVKEIGCSCADCSQSSLGGRFCVCRYNRGQFYGDPSFRCPPGKSYSQQDIACK
ncbi:MAG: SCP-like extracellular protein domain [Barrevirus sp.]|uniref:SCP-like extracellular protein domain n=1 Tax=Barrevirus sp. TaxID=2487763 RepID=A0A3G4ZQ81_9VIRU|nr:MAG: SCP-like extracellular protein domain [Barrevirus sp.]